MSTSALPFWLSGWGDSELKDDSELAEEPEMPKEPEIIEEPEMAEEADKTEKWHTLEMPCGIFGVAACPGGVNPSINPTTTTTTTTEAPPGIFGLDIEVPGVGIVLREGNIELSEKLKPIALPCGVFPLPACPGGVNPSNGSVEAEEEAAPVEAANDSWWPQGRKANVDLRWNKLKMPCGVFGAPACPGGVNE